MKKEALNLFFFFFIIPQKKKKRMETVAIKMHSLELFAEKKSLFVDGTLFNILSIIYILKNSRHLFHTAAGSAFILLWLL